METIHQLLELFPYAIAGSILAGIICSFLGIFIVSQRVVFLGAVLTQVSIAGVAFSFLHFINLENIISGITGLNATKESFFHNFEPVIFSLVFAIITVFIFSQTYNQKFLTQDGILGIIFVVAVAARLMFIQKSPVAEVSEIETILKGDILFINSSGFFSLLTILILTGLVFILFQKQLKFVTFDAETAAAHGINSKMWLVVFYFTVGIGISLTTRFVGDVFAFAYLIIPASMGILLATKVRNVFLISIITGAVVPPLSIFLAFKFDFSSGPMAVVTSFVLFVIVFLIKRIKG
jgi:zinc transport system permease protein